MCMQHNLCFFVRICINRLVCAACKTRGHETRKVRETVNEIICTNTDTHTPTLTNGRMLTPFQCAPINMQFQKYIIVSVVLSRYVPVFCVRNILECILCSFTLHIISLLFVNFMGLWFFMRMCLSGLPLHNPLHVLRVCPLYRLVLRIRV